MTYKFYIGGKKQCNIFKESICLLLYLNLPSLLGIFFTQFSDFLIFFFLLNMLWSRHVKPSPAIGEKSERSEIKDIKVCTD